MMALIPIFFLIACVYSIVGLSGGSSYLAVLAWMGSPREILVPMALLCNLASSARGTYSYYQAGFFRPQLFWPLSLASIPFAFLGGLTPISDKTFHLLLGFSLLMAALRMFFPKPLIARDVFSLKIFWIVAPVAGALLGFLAGLIGLGGGIFLAPLLILSGVASAKETAATTAPFIFVNSLAGFLAHFENVTTPLVIQTLPLLIAVSFGALIGSKLGIRRLSNLWVQRTAASLLSLVSFKLLGRVLL